MARDFDGVNYLINTNAAVTGAPASFAAWFNVDSVANQDTVVDCGNEGPDTALDNFGMVIRGDLAGDPVTAHIRSDSITNWASTTTGVSVDTWHHGAAVFRSTTSRDAYIDGGSKGSSTTLRNPSTIDNTGIAVARTNAQNFWQLDGSIAEVGIWNVALTDAEVAILAAGFSPLFVRPANLVAYWPLIGRYSPEIDRVGGFDMTLVNTPGVADHPRIIYPTLKFPLLAPAAVAVGVLLRRLTASPDLGFEAGYKRLEM